ncbi:hypothetical protein VCR6J2_220111 [Vibrio coralliirubri]|nr:hypothetical protein VCR6J2_220111 [Vibrio coralliirubri]CDT22920.1 hypothetical protein VCR1J2_220310 [Vibrio coralliirubri]CDT87378.1 hypothetical protein VCR8J2_250129 [Vibrio coralliirubri]
MLSGVEGRTVSSCAKEVEENPRSREQIHCNEPKIVVVLRSMVHSCVH